MVSSIQAQAVGFEEQTLNGKGHQGGCLRGQELELENGPVLTGKGTGEMRAVGPHPRWPSAPVTACWVPYLLGVENQACFNLGGDGRWLI